MHQLTTNFRLKVVHEIHKKEGPITIISKCYQLTTIPQSDRARIEKCSFYEHVNTF